MLTGEKTVRRADVMEDTGASISPNVDIGQVEGAFVMGLGLWLSEELRFNPTSGRLLTRDSWEYKPPASQDIPEVFNTYLYNSNDNPFGVLGSKATGEPPLLMAMSAFLALRDAITDCRVSLGMERKDWFQFDGPGTNERVIASSGITSDYFKLY
ncbi:xanthine dehydrogenase/oxidase-like [Tigriopus californicus]|uniref:xanthine dehydrogenase/oxidase-like n=1 Tax=Tigriopus californicus TaxID=6832 RepID=UPI0027DA9D74|nr:xanthine dehydrogenase/oxidase-like [Tigriopus californicus]